MKNTNFPRKAISLLLALITVLGVMPLNIIALGEEPSVTIQYNGSDASSVSLVEDDKITLDTKVANFDGEVKYQWEILADEEEDIWVKIGDKTQAKCEITYALVKSCLNERGRAQMRVTVTSGEQKATSKPVEIKVSYLVNDYQPTVAYETADKGDDNTAFALDSVLDIFSMPVKAAEGDGISIINVYFYFQTESGRLIKTLHYPLALGYEGFTVDFPVEIGYLPYYNGDQVSSLEVPAGLTDSKIEYTIIYKPQEVDYKVYHYLQNANDDGYTLEDTTPHRGIVENQVGNDLHKQYEGFEYISYARPVIAPDGSTAVEIYYNRVYHTVLFRVDSEYKGAYGQDNLYVRYGTTVGVNNLHCEGYVFEKWELISPKDSDTYPELHDILSVWENDYDERKIKVNCNIEYKAILTEAGTSYKIFFWRENADDGLYSLWHEHTEPANTGDTLTWKDSYLDYIAGFDELEYFTLNWEKTEEDWKETAGEGSTIDSPIKVLNDGSTVINIYYARRRYTINFYADTSLKDSNGNYVCNMVPHTHGVGYCKFNPYNCEHPGDHTEHSHTDECGVLNCNINGGKAHIHNPYNCCDTHVHDKGCYSMHTTFAEAEALNEQIKTQVQANTEKQVQDFFSFSIPSSVVKALANIINSITGNVAEIAAKEASGQLASKEPPKNIQNGYIQYLNGVSIDYNETKRIVFWDITLFGTVTLDIPAIYIEDGDGNPNNNWHYYTGSLKDGEIQEADKCSLPDHDHTSGCTYGEDCEACKNGTCDVVHKCDLTEHIHGHDCFTTCIGPENGYHHTAECYSYACMIPEHKHGDNADQYHGTNTLVATIQAKYGQSILEYLKYYSELDANGIAQNGSNQKFLAWKYAGTGWGNTNSITRYVKHVTMVGDLCYSQGVDAFAVYNTENTESNPVEYKLHYMFETLDTNPMDTDEKHYTEDLNHYQVVWWPQGKPLSEMKADSKDITGFKAAGAILEEGTTDYNIYYNRKDYQFTIYNQEDELRTYPVKFGQSLSSIKYMLLDGIYFDFANEQYVEDGKSIDVANMVYPDGLEPGAYVFDKWYSTNTKNKYTVIDWDNDVVTEDNLYAFAIWNPVVRTVKVYHDVSKKQQFSTDGYQEVAHRAFAKAPSLDEVNLDINGDGINDLYFAGWFYFDEEKGEEAAFLFDFPIKQDMEIYAKWSSNTIVNYEIRYVIKQEDSNGNEETIHIADPTVGIGVLGHNKTFTPKYGSNLYDTYQTGYYPETSSHTIRMGYDEDNNYVATVVYEFVYEGISEVKYKVQYLESGSGAQLLPDMEYTTTDPGAWAMFLPIDGYTPDKLSKSIILSSNEEENIIAFYYTKNETPEEGGGEEEPIPQAPWIMNHYVANYPDGDTYKLYSSSETFLNDISCEKNGFVKYGGTYLDNILGYEFDYATVVYRYMGDDGLPVEVETDPIELDADGNIKYALTEYGMSINFYYKRVPVKYTVQYIDENGNVFAFDERFNQEIFSEENLHGKTVSVTVDPELNAILRGKGYGLASGTTISITLDPVESRNVVRFQYTPRPVFYYYNIVGVDDPALAGVSLSLPTESIDANSTANTKGSTAKESDKYYFDGWYADAECTVLVTKDPYIQPKKTANGIYEDATYYALFLPRNANTSIQVTSKHGDNFIVQLVGKEGTLAAGMSIEIAVVDGVAKLVNLPVGTYTVTIKTDWSWRYGDVASQEMIVDVPATEDAFGGQIEIDLTENDAYNQSNWLDDYGYDEYKSN